jgi:HPt (histidine-containing phosphotransfer) domain-containing protein
MTQYSFLYLDENRLNEQSLNDQYMREQMVDSFLLHFPEIISRVEKALQKKDGGSLARSIHSLKASLGLFGVDALQSQAARVEVVASAIHTNETLLEAHLTIAKAKALVKEVEVLKEQSKK